MDPNGIQVVEACSSSNSNDLQGMTTSKDISQHDATALNNVTKTPTANKRIRISEPPHQHATKTDDTQDNTEKKHFYVTPQSKGIAEENSPQLSKEDVRSLLLNEAGYDVSERSAKALKRQKYLCWDDMFFGVAVLSSMRSKDPSSPCGACIVDSENRIVGIGYDGAPGGVPDDCIPWTDAAENTNIPFLHTHKPYGVHAEVNAILNKCSTDVAGARMYVERFPCNECAKIIIQSRIQEVVYMKDLDPDKDAYRASRIMLAMAGVKTRQYTPSIPLIDLDFVSALAPTNNEVVGKVGADSSSSGNCCSSGTCASSDQQAYRDLMVKEANFDPVANGPSHRTNYISWDDYFIAMAFLTAKRSKDPNTQVGAVIVDSDTKRILALGYNGFPRGCSDDVLPWSRQGSSELHKKYLFVVHAEVNAVLNKCSSNVKGATLYVALFPCNDCAKVIIQAGIKEVVFMADFYHDTDACRASRIMFAMAGVKLRKYIPSFQSLRLEMNKTEDARN